MASRRIERTKSFSSYLSSINDEVSILKSRADTTGLGPTSGSVSGDSLADELSLASNGIHSSNYIPNYAGWRISGSGVAEFSDVFVRGDINAYSGTIGYWNISSPYVSRVFGDTTLYGTFLESSAIGDSDVNKTSGTYVGLFKSYELTPNLITSKYRRDNIATITTPNHAFLLGDKVYISIDNDVDGFSALASPVSIIQVTGDTISYVNDGVDFTNLDSSGNAITNDSIGTVTLYNPDVAGLYVKDYSKREFDYGYFSNTGVSYVSAEDINILENPSFEYKDIDGALQTATTSWSAGTGLTLATLDISNGYQNDSVYGGKLTWSNSGLSTYLTASLDYSAGDTYGIFDIGRSLYFGISLFPYYVPVAKTITSIESYTTGGYYLKVNSTSHGFSAGDTVFLDVDATYSTTTHSPHTIADGTSGYTFTVLTSPAPSTNYFYITANGTSTPAGQVLTLTSHKARSNSVYKVYEAALDLSAIRLRYGNGSTTAISNVLSTATKAQWDAGINKYLLSNANTYMLAYLDDSTTGIDIPAMYKKDLIILDAASIKAAYKTADATNFAAAADIYLDIPGWLLKHDGNGVVSATKLTDSVSIGYIADNAYLSTASNFFYGTYLATNRWYGTTNNITSYNPAQASIEGSKPWLDINLAGQSAHLDYFDYIGFRNNTFSKTMTTRPSLGMYDSTDTYVPFPDADYDTTTLTSGQYQYKYFTDAYRNISSTLKLITGDRSTGFELSARAVDLDSVGAITPAKAVVISGLFDQNDSETATIRMASDRFVWTNLADQITTEERVVFEESQVTLNIPLQITASSLAKSIRAAGGLEVTSGPIRTLSGDIETNNGNISTTVGNIYTSSGKVTANTASLTSTSQYDLTNGSIHPLQIGLNSGDNVRMDNNGIQAVSTAAASTLNINTFGGNVTIGNASSTISIPGTLSTNITFTDIDATGHVSAGGAIYTSTGNIRTLNGDVYTSSGNIYTSSGGFTGDTIRLNNTAIANTTSTGHAFQIGASNLQNLRISADRIQSLSNGTATPLTLNGSGGNVTIGNASSTISIPGTLSTNITFTDIDATGHVSAGGAIYTSTGNIRTLNGDVYTSSGNIYTSSGGFTGDTIRLNSVSDVSTGSQGFQIGLASSGKTNLRMDTNGVQAYTYNTASTLYLNNYGGNVTIGNASSTISIPGYLSTPSFSVSGDFTSTAGGFVGSFIRLSSTDSVGTGTVGFRLGSTSSYNLQMDRNSIQTYLNGGNSNLGINAFGGNVTIGATGAGNNANLSIPNGTLTTSGNIISTSGNLYSSSGDIYAVNGTVSSSTIRATSTTNITNTSTTHAFQIGLATTATANLRMDSNGVSAFTYNTPDTLYLNVTGADVAVGSTSSGTLVLRNYSGAGSTTGASINTTGAIVRTTSSARYKQDIVNIEYEYNDILLLNPKQFKLKDEVLLYENPRVYGGFIAEELNEIDSLKVFVNYIIAEDGSKIPDGIAYGEMVSALVSAIKHQDGLIKLLSSRLDALEAK